MDYSRRQFTRLLPVALAGQTVLAMPLLAEPKPNYPVLDRQRFEPLVGTEFRLESESHGSQKLRLVAVEDLGRSRTSRVEIDRTCLRFAGSGPQLPADSYLLKHDELGEFLLFLEQGLPGRYRANLAHVPAEYLNSVAIPQAAPKKITVA